MKIIKNISKITHEVDYYVCDICNKRISDEESYSFSHSHNDWGNDSCESYQSFDVCSFECYIKKMEYSFEEYNNYYGYEADHKNKSFIKSMIDYLKKLKGIKDVDN